MSAGVPRPDSAILGAATRFLDSLPPEIRKRAVFSFDSPSRTDWAYTPRDRVGVALKDLSPTQRDTAKNLLRAALSEKGYSKAEDIRALEEILREWEGPHRDPELYLFTFFGEPSPDKPWAWRYEGHHLSLNYSFNGNRLVSTTPQFFGANPGNLAIDTGTSAKPVPKPLAIEESLGRELAKSLTSGQRKVAVLSEVAPADIITSNTRKAAIKDDRGLPYSRLDSKQQQMLWKLIETHAEAQIPDVAKARLERIRKAGTDQLRFAWMGGLEPGQGHYYRIQGPTFLIEYDNTQNHANHIHTVWRDFDGDFGMDVLEEHYLTSPHHRHHQ